MQTDSEEEEDYLEHNVRETTYAKAKFALIQSIIGITTDCSSGD